VWLRGMGVALRGSSNEGESVELAPVGVRARAALVLLIAPWCEGMLMLRAKAGGLLKR